MEFSAIALGGLDRATAQFQDAANRLAGAAAPAGAGPDRVDLSDAAVSLLAARNDFSANLAVLKVADRMEGRALDLVG